MKKNLWLIKLRSDKNLTHDQVAESVGIDRSYYTKIENGQTPSVKIAKKIGVVLNFDWTLFFDNCCDKTSQKTHSA